ncbi:MAG: gfo/Idh/MocA family oxidoreductase [Clostridiales bacterium]|jgi:predicted dehydrogenase|nr:gfo/Idh/MocA family oxidoreductase [Clostridiales bacterium]
MKNKDGMYYVPAQKKAAKVCAAGDFIFSAAGLDHGHIYGMVSGLINAGATLKYVYDPDPAKVAAFLKTFPTAVPASREAQVLDDKEAQLVASACVTSERCALGLKVMDSGKHYFADKAPLTTLEQLESAQKKVIATDKKYAVYYSERLHVESAVLAGMMIKDGVIGQVLQVIGLGPHRLNAPTRPAWFFEKEKYGGILCDIGSHQIEQYLYFAGEEDAQVVRSQIANYKNPAHPGLDDFGDAMLVGQNGTTNYFRVDWFTPDALRTWGDGRTMILGTDGYIEIRKYADIGTDGGADTVLLVNHETEKKMSAAGTVGFPFFGELILDCLNHTERAMTQAHAFKAAELCIKAQLQAVRIGPEIRDGGL